MLGDKHYIYREGERSMDLIVYGHIIRRDDGESSEILWNEEMRTRVVKLAENVKQGCDGNGCEIRRDEGESSEILNNDVMVWVTQ
jgi:hypothetical protein